MDDKQIIELFWTRSETALNETQEKYGGYCYYIANQIVSSEEDAKECVNDAYIRVWNAIPPNRPGKLSAFIGKIVRNIALDRYKSNNAAKRGNGQITLALEELQECIPGNSDGRNYADTIALGEALKHFLRTLSPDTRKVFMRRYWYMASIEEIARAYFISESKVKMTLFRTRKALRDYLEKEGIHV